MSRGRIGFGCYSPKRQTGDGVSVAWRTPMQNSSPWRASNLASVDEALIRKGGEGMSNALTTTAPTQFLQMNGHSYAYRRFGNGSGLPLLCLQHFTGTLDNWDPAVSDPLASRREVILFDNAGIGRSNGEVPETIAGMATHVMAFLDGLG